MSLSDKIRSAVDATFAPDQRPAVLDGLATIPDEHADPLRARPPAEFLQAAVLVLAHGDAAIFDGQLLNARIEPRDVIYVLQSPSEIHPDLTRAELVRRYQELDLPVPELLAGET